MTFVAVNADGTEVIGNDLIRGYYDGYHSLNLESDYFPVDEDTYTHYVSPHLNLEEEIVDVAVVLPKGTIAKLIGKKLTFQDKPVKL